MFHQYNQWHVVYTFSGGGNINLVEELIIHQKHVCQFTLLLLYPVCISYIGGSIGQCMSQISVRRRCPLLGVSVIRGSTVLQKPQKKKTLNKLLVLKRSINLHLIPSLHGLYVHVVLDNTHIIHCSIQ